MRRLPPLSALRVFEVAARTASFTQAGAELGLTHGAVSRHIGPLEAWFGQRLFVRVGRRMAATPAARAFAAEVSLSFDRLIAAAEACGRPEAARVLRVSAPSTFAMRWLIPRLDRFRAARPEADVTVTTTTTLHGELRGGFDLAIRRGTGAWPHQRAVPFLDEADTLVASPGLLARGALAVPSDIEQHRLLATETRPNDWTEWLSAAGLSLSRARQRRVFDHFFVTLQAVEDGLGLGIGPFPVLDGTVRAGRLAVPFPDIRVARPGYVVLIPSDTDKTPSLLALVDWLTAEGSSSAATAAPTARTPSR